MHIITILVTKKPQCFDFVEMLFNWPLKTVALSPDSTVKPNNSECAHLCCRSLPVLFLDQCVIWTAASSHYTHNLPLSSIYSGFFCFLWRQNKCVCIISMCSKCAVHNLLAVGNCASACSSAAIKCYECIVCRTVSSPLKCKVKSFYSGLLSNPGESVHIFILISIVL